MRLELIGLNHRTSSLEVRDKAAIAPDRLEEALRELTATERVEGAAILSTCNRTEVYLSPTRHHEPPELRALLCHVTGLSPDEANSCYLLRDRDAVRHVMRLAAGLDSQMLGEVQILGQLKTAYAEALGHGATNSVLNKVLLRAVETGKEVRNRTGISQGAVSVASAAVQMGQRIFGTLEGRNVLLVGAGETARLAANHLGSAGVTNWRVANRTEANAKVVADLLGGRVVAFPPAVEDLAWADVVVCATGAPEPVITEATVKPAAKKRRRPQLLLDLAVPRDVAPDVRDQDDVYLYNVDDFEELVAANLQAREKEAQRAEKIVDKNVEEFDTWYRENRIAPTIQQLQVVLETLRAEEVAKQQKRFSPEDHEQLEKFSRTLMKKVTGLLAANLKRASLEEQDGLAMAKAVALAMARNDSDETLTQVLERLDHELSH